MPALALALLLTIQAAPTQDVNEVAPVLIQPNGWLGGPVPTEDNIVRSLNELLLAEPDRVVCIPKETTGTRRKLNYCATLQHWYDVEMDRNTPGKKALMGGPTAHGEFVNTARPPYELINMITQRYRDPKAREQARVHAVTTTPASPPQRAVSHP